MLSVPKCTINTTQPPKIFLRGMHTNLERIPTQSDCACYRRVTLHFISVDLPYLRKLTILIIFKYFIIFNVKPFILDFSLEWINRGINLFDILLYGCVEKVDGFIEKWLKKRYTTSIFIRVWLKINEGGKNNYINISHNYNGYITLEEMKNRGKISR